MKFAIIGTGVVGTALAVLLEKAGYECVGVHTRSKASYRRFREYLRREQLPLEKLVPRAELVFITTQDMMIRSVAEDLVKQGLVKPGQAWIHCSGSMSSQELRVAPSLPVRCLSLHPLQTFASVEEALTILAGTHFGLEGDDPELGESIVLALGGIPHRIRPEGKILYHAGAVMVSNYLVVLARLGEELLERAGIQSGQALELLLPLMRGTVYSLEKVGLPRALTGPIARGDGEVVREHLENMPDKLVEIYRALGREALELAVRKSALRESVYPPGPQKELEKLLADWGPGSKQVFAEAPPSLENLTREGTRCSEP